MKAMVREDERIILKNIKENFPDLLSIEELKQFFINSGLPDKYLFNNILEVLENLPYEAAISLFLNKPLD